MSFDVAAATETTYKGSVIRDSIASSPPMSRDDWLVAFMRAVLFVYPNANRTRVRRAAIAEYVTHSQDLPVEAARMWLGRNKVG